MKKIQCEAPKREIAVYSRKSKFTGKGESIENQIELCRRYIETTQGGPFSEKEKKWNGKIRIYEDEGFSGGNLERPQFKQMMEDARQGRVSKIIVYRLDRISRNIGDFAGLIEELNHLNVDFISIKEQFDTSSPLGRAMMYIASVFSQLERETIAERIRDNMLELAKTGRWLGGRTPTGYASESVSSVTMEGKVKKCCRLKMVPEEAALVQEIFSRYLNCGSLKETAEGMTKEGRKTKTGKAFTPVAVRAILANPVYAAADEDTQRYFLERGVPLFLVDENSRENTDRGIIAYNRTLQRPGKSSRTREIREWIVAVGKHEPIVPGSIWVKVQLRLEENQKRI